MAEAYDASQVFRDQMARTQQELSKSWALSNQKLETAASAYGAKVMGLEKFNNPGIESFKRIQEQWLQPFKIPSLASAYEPPRIDTVGQIFEQMKAHSQITSPRLIDFISPVSTESILKRAYESWAPAAPWINQVMPDIRSGMSGINDIRSASAAQIQGLIGEVREQVPEEVQEDFLAQVVEPAVVELADEQLQNPSDGFLESFNEIVAQLEDDADLEVSPLLGSTDIVDQVRRTTGFADFSARFGQLSETRVAYAVSVCIVTSVFTTIMCFVPAETQHFILTWIAVLGLVTRLK